MTDVCGFNQLALLTFDLEQKGNRKLAMLTETRFKANFSINFRYFVLGVMSGRQDME